MNYFNLLYQFQGLLWVIPSGSQLTTWTRLMIITMIMMITINSEPNTHWLFLGKESCPWASHVDYGFSRVNKSLKCLSHADVMFLDSSRNSVQAAEPFQTCHSSPEWAGDEWRALSNLDPVWWMKQLCGRRLVLRLPHFEVAMPLLWLWGWGNAVVLWKCWHCEMKIRRTSVNRRLRLRSSSPAWTD